MTKRAVTVHVDPRLCEGHTELSPDVFDLTDDDIVTVTDEHPGEQHWAALHAGARRCTPLPPPVPAKPSR